MKDGQGLEVGNADEAAIAAIDFLTAEWLAFGDRLPEFVATAEREARCALLPLLAASLLLTVNSRDAFALARRHWDRARALAVDPTPREQAWLAATEAWFAGARDRAQAIHEEMASRWPRDLLAAKVGQLHALERGDSRGILRIGERILPANRDNHYVWAMAGFGLEECNRLDEAEAHARTAIAMERNDPWAHHVLAHCLEARGRLPEGAAFLRSVADTWERCNSFMYTHNWWHLALFLIDLERTDEALALHDSRVWTRERDFAEDQINAISLLARLELRGVDVGPRWQSLAGHLEPRLHEHFSPFLDLQFLYGLARAGRRAAVTEMLASLEDRAERAVAWEREAWADCAVPAAHGLAAYAVGDVAGAARLLGRAMPHLHALGGSLAQKGLFGALHLDALMKAGWNDAALAVLQADDRERPTVPWTKRALGDLYRRVGRAEQASLAEVQAERLSRQYQKGMAP